MSSVSGYDSQAVKYSVPSGQRKAAPRVTMRGMLVALGLSMYVASFFFWAVEDSGWIASKARGYSCAELTLESPFSEDGRSQLHEKPIEYFSIPGSGLINPL